MIKKGLPQCDVLSCLVMSNSLRSYGLWLSIKESACSEEATGDTGSIPGSGRSPGGGHGNPLQYSCPENPMHRGAWQLTIHKVLQRVRHN